MIVEKFLCLVLNIDIGVHMENNNKINVAAGALVGYGVYKFTPTICYKVRKATIGRILDAPLTTEQISVYSKAGQDLFESKFKPKGYSILDLSKPENLDFPERSLRSLEQYYDNKIALSKNFISKLYTKYKKAMVRKDNIRQHKQVVEGSNAYYWVKNRSVVINMEKKPVYLFHEFGHAIDYSMEGISKSMSTIWRNPSLRRGLFGGVVITSLLTNQKSKEDLEKAKFGEKFVQFIKRNGALIVGAFLVPSTLEEIMANLNGQKLAKEFVPKAHMPRVTKSHMNSAIGYILYPIIMGGSVYLANKLRDKIVQKA